MFRTSVLSLCFLLLVVKNSQPKVKPLLTMDALHDREKLVYNVVRNQIAERSSGIIGQLMREDLNKINALKNKLGINYINYFNNNNGGILENGLPFNIDGVADDDFTQYIDYTEDCAEYMGLTHYISQHATNNVEGEDVSSIHKFPTHKILRFIASRLNYGEANGATSMDAGNGAAQCRTNEETYYSSTTAHPSASALLEPSHGPTYASYLCISPSTIRAVVTRHRLIRLLTQRHDNHHLITSVAVWGDTINIYASTAASFWMIHNDDIPPNVTIMRVGPCKKTTHFDESHGCSIGGSTNDICEVHIIGGWSDIHRCFSVPNVPCVKNGELPSIGINAYFLRLVNSLTEFHQTRANSSTIQYIITSLRVYIFGLYKKMYYILSFEEGVEPTLICQRNHAILLWGDSTDFIHRCVMRYFDRVSRNDGGDTPLLDESVLVDMMDTTYLMENSEVIHDDEYVLMTSATSGMNGEPYTLVDMTSNVIPVWINENVFKSTSIWGAWLSDVVGQCCKIITSTAVTDGEIVEGLLSSPGDSSVYGEESRDDVDGSINIALGCNQSNDAVAYFSDIKDERHGVVDLRSSDPVWHVEADGIQSLFGLELRRAMGRLTLQRINGGVCCSKWLDFVGELQEQYEGMRCSIKSTVETGSNKADEQRVSDENSTQHGCNFAKRMTVTVDDSSLLVLTTETTCAATVNTPTITLLWRLHRLSTQLYSLGMFSFGNYSDFYNNDISYCLSRFFSRLRCLSYAWTTRIEKYVSGEGIMRPSCASLTIGETLQEGIKKAENAKFIQNDISPTENHTSVHLHRTFLSRGASLPNLLSASSICVLQIDLSSCGTIVMDDDKSYATGIAYCGDGNTSCHDTCDQDTTWGAVDKSSSIVFNTSAASTAMFCVSSTCTTALLQRLLRISTRLFSLEVLIIDSFDSDITNQISCIHCLYTVTTLETAELASVRCLKRASCTSPVDGKRFMCRLDKAIHSYSIQDNDASSGNYSLFDVYWNHKQLMNRRNICADDTASASTQQLMGSASCLPRCRLVIMSTILAKLHALHLVFGTTELEPRIFTARSATICGYCYGDVQHDRWKCLCASLGLLVGLLLLLRRVMGSHTLQIVESKAGHYTFVNLCHDQLSRMYVNDVLHSFFSKPLVDYIARERATLGKRWVGWTIRPNLAIRMS